MEPDPYVHQDDVPLTRKAAREADNAVFVHPEGTITRRHLDHTRPAPRLVRSQPRSRFERAPQPILAPPVLAQHARRRRAEKLRVGFAAVAATALLLGGTVAVAGAAAGGMLAPTATLADASVISIAPKAPTIAVELESVIPVATEIPAPSIVAAPLGDDVCATAEMSAALNAGDATAVLAAAGGAAKFREVVAAGTAACLSLSDPGYPWVVVNKQRPYSPIDYMPAVGGIDGIQNLTDSELRSDAASALAQLVAATANAGAGDLGLISGYRSYSMQQNNFGSGGAEVEASVARPGYSEHQSGLAADIVACSYGSCGSLDDFGGTAQGQWVAANAWQYGWIVRYEAATTGITGYIPEPWHLRYIGVELAAEYHAGGWLSLEEFFGLPASPDYVD